MTQRPNPRTDPCAVGGESLSSPFHMPPCQGLWFSGSISDGVLGEPLCFPWWLAGKLHLPTLDSMTRFFFFFDGKMSRHLIVARLAFSSPPPAPASSLLLYLALDPHSACVRDRQSRDCYMHPSLSLPHSLTRGLEVNPHSSPERWVLLFYRRKSWSCRTVSPQLVRSSREGAELGSELGKSGTEADGLGFSTQLPSGKKDAHLHPAPCMVPSTQ